MTSSRRHSNWWKRAFSVALAHFVAIQLVLGAAVAVQMASIAPAEAAPLCADGHGAEGYGGQPGDNGGGSVHHDICMACAFTAHATPLPSAVAIDHDGRSLAHAMLPDLSVASVGKSSRAFKQARGPPALA